MTIFNSLGSNYDFRSAMRILFARGGHASRTKLTKYLETRYGGTATLVYKGREALYLAATAIEEGAIAINGYTCLAVYEAIKESGHAIHYIDILENGLNFSPSSLQETLAANPSIQAVVIQNTLGVGCDIQTIKKLCERHGVALIEDLAHSIGTRYASGEEAGTVGDMVILTFSQDKVVDAVSGGALIIRNPKYQLSSYTAVHLSAVQGIKDRLYPLLTWKVRAGYALHVGKYTHAILRWSRVLSTPFGKESARCVRLLPAWYCANILCQYSALDTVAAHRRAIAEVYRKIIDKRVLIPFDPAFSANLRFPILTENRDDLIEYLRKQNVFVSDIWYDAPVAPKKYLHLSNYGEQCPHAERISEMMLNLPTHINVTPDQAETIAHYINQWLTTHTNTLVIKEITDKKKWEEFQNHSLPHSFLHSWKWGEHYEQTGSKVFRLGAYQGLTLVGTALLIEIRARRGSFLLCPHGPIIAKDANEVAVLGAIVARAERIGGEKRCDFLRFCPLDRASDTSRTLYQNLGFRDAPIHMHPELAWMLDITKTEENLLREMRKTTRYLVKKMEKEGVEITQSADPEDIEKFWPVYLATVQRQHFTPFSKESLKKEFKLFAKDNQAAFFFGTYKGEIVAAAIIIFYNGQAFYHHSGSIHKSKDINASYLLQWRVIQEAKRRGCTLYNFWGISPDNRPKHPWAGLSLFKKGFGGYAEEYLHAQDKPITNKYWLNFVVETLRRFKRGL